MKEAWPHLRAGLVALHLFAITLMALPAPPASVLRKSAWNTPTVKAELAFWTEQLNAVGIDWTQKEVRGFAWDFVTEVVPLRKKVLGPFLPYYRYCGTWQSWTMFVAPQTHPARLVVEVDHGDGWETVFETRSSEHGWNRAFFDHDRLRAATFRYSWKSYQTHYESFATYVARELVAEDPGIERVRTSWARYKTPDAATLRAEGLPEPTIERPFVVEARSL